MVRIESDELDAQMARLCDGDRGAFEPLYAALRPRVVALCRAMLGHPQDAEDAAQSALEKVFARASLYDRSRPVVPWVLGIAAWECRALRQRRRRRREEALGAQDLPLLEEQTLSEQIVRNELHALAQRALDTLSERDHEVLTATFWDEVTAEGATLRKRRQRALGRLRTACRRLYGLDATI